MSLLSPNVIDTWWCRWSVELETLGLGLRLATSAGVRILWSDVCIMFTQESVPSRSPRWPAAAAAVLMCDRSRGAAPRPGERRSGESESVVRRPRTETERCCAWYLLEWVTDWLWSESKVFFLYMNSTVKPVSLSSIWSTWHYASFLP